MFNKFHATLLIVSIGVSFLMTSPAARATEEKAGGDYARAISAARESVWKAITSGGGSGATVAVMDNGKIVYSECFGVADRSTNRPVDKDTRFNIGSTSKMFAAVAVLLLADEGKVALDAPVARYIPEFKMKDERYQDITVRMLFNHSSGLPGSTFYFGYKPDFSLRAVLLDTLKDASLKHAPGAMSIYCNDGFTLAEILVERVSGEKYVDFLAERIFAPLGMKNTAASIGELNETNAAEYYDAKTGRKYPREVVPVYGAGGMSSTAEDLCRFGDSFSLKGKRILSDASIREILKIQPTGLYDRLKGMQIMNAFGWDYSDLPDYQAMGLQVVSKNGGTMCYSTNLQIVPQERLVIGFSISGKADPGIITLNILNALLADKNLAPQKPTEVKIPVQPQPIPADLLKYAGYYVNEKNPVRAVFNKQKNTLTIYPVLDKKTAKAITAQPLTFIYNSGYFYIQEKGMKCYFDSIDGTTYIISHDTPLVNIDIPLFQKITPVKKPSRLKKNIDGKIWLIRNMPFHVELHVVENDNPLMTTSSLHEELPGYVRFNCGINRIDASDHASIAATAFRDQAALALFERDGKLWAKSGAFLYVAADGVGKINHGTNSVRIGDGGFNEWLRVEKGATLTFEKPENGRVVVTTPGAILFDSVLDSGEVYAPAGSYIFCAANAGDEFTIQAR